MHVIAAQWLGGPKDGEYFVFDDEHTEDTVLRVQSGTTEHWSVRVVRPRQESCGCWVLPFYESPIIEEH